MGQTRVGVRKTPSSVITPSTLWNSIYSVWNADALGTSLDTSIYATYNGDNVNDSSVNALNGTNVNNVTFTAGKVGNAFTFNGSNYIGLPNSSNQFNFTTDFSFSFWVYIPSISTATNGIFANYTNVGGSKGFIAYLKNDGKFEFLIFGTNGTSTIASTSQISTGWTHIVVTRKMITDKESYIYINGVLNAQSGINNAVTLDFYTTSNPSIGAINSLDTGSVQNLFGQMMNNSKIDGLTVWNKVLTANEVTSLYNGGTGAEYPFSSQLLPSPNDSVGLSDSILMNGASFTTGKIGKAFTFDGINDYVALPNNIMKFSNTDNWSVSFWIYQTAGAYSGVIGNWNYSGGQGTGWGIRTGGSVVGNQSKFTIHLFTNWVTGTGTPLNILQTDGATNINEWNHFVITRNSSAQEKIYQNGTLVASQTNSSTKLTYPATSYSCIGAERYSSTAVTGYAKTGSKIDAMSVWDKELNASEVTELYNSGNGKQYPN